MLIERQRAVRLARRRNRDRLPLSVIGFIRARDYKTQSVDGATQQNHDQTARILIGGRCPSARPNQERNSSRRSEKISTKHGSTYRRMKSGLPRIRAEWRPFGDSLMAVRVASLKVEPKMASRRSASTLCAASATLGFAPTNAVAKLIRRVVASGLSQASSVFLYPSGVRQPKRGIPSWSIAPSSGRTLPTGAPAARTAEITNWYGVLYFAPLLSQNSLFAKSVLNTSRILPSVSKNRAARCSTSAAGGSSATKYCASSNEICRAVAGLRARISSASSPSALPRDCSGRPRNTLGL